MQTRPPIQPLQPKTWQLDTAPSGTEGYLYHCLLCEEALVLSKKQINPQKIQIIFNNTCPGCGFELDRVLSVQSAPLPPGRRLLTSLKCRDAHVLQEPVNQSQYELRTGKSLPRSFQADLTTGIESIDRTLVLKRGQLVYLQGEQSHPLSLLLCVRATLPEPEGLDTGTVFIDAGNIFDPYTISHHTISHELDLSSVNRRIHLSRAFTHHQVHNLIVEKLASAATEYEADFAVVSDMTLLFCDPDVRDKRESLDMFRKSVRHMAATAENRNMIILVTNQKRRNKTMEQTVAATAHVSALLKDHESYTQLTVTRHPFTTDQKETISDPQTLTGYLEQET